MMMAMISSRMTTIIPARTQWNICVVCRSMRCSNSFGSLGGALGIAVGA